MNITRLVVSISLCLSAASTMAQAQEEPSIRQLGWLVGEWDFVDGAVEGDYRENGSRSCRYTLDGQYIACESRGTSHTGNERTYINYFNYNHLEGRFEITALFGNFPGKILHVADVSDDGHRLLLKYGAWEGEGINVETHAVVVYNGTDRYTWESHAAHDGPETGEHEVRFRDFSTRRESRR